MFANTLNIRIAARLHAGVPVRATGVQKMFAHDDVIATAK
jgi:hypothetical protein